MADAQINLPPEADTFINRVRKVEGTLGGKGYVKYGGEEFTPTKDHPATTGWEGVDIGDGKKTHAAGPGQWQPGTWDEQKKKFKGYGLDLDFSNEQHQKAAIWDKGYEEYKKSTGRDLREDLKANKVEWSKLAPTWQGFEPRVTRTDKPGGKIDPQSIAYEQSRPHQSVWYVDPKEMLDLLPEVPEKEQKSKWRSLQKSLFDRGEDIYDLPSVELSGEGDRRKISEFDGRNRLKAMAEAGLTAVPVVLKGVEPDVRPIALEGMTDKVMPLKFDPVPKVEVKSNPALDPREAAKRLIYGQQGQPLPAPPERGLFGGQVPQTLGAGRQTLGGAMHQMQARPSEPQFVPGEAAQPVAEGLARGPEAMRIAEPPPVGGNALGGLAPEAPAGSAPNALGRLAPEEAPLAPLARQTFGETRVGTPQAQQAFNRNAIREMGEDAPHATQDVMERARVRIGSGLERIESSHAVTFDQEFRDDMIRIQRDAEKELTTKGQLRVVKGLLNDVMVDPVKTEAAKTAAKAVKPAEGEKKAPPKEVLRSRLSGEQFGNLIHQDGPVAKIANHSDPAVAEFGQEVRSALQDLLQRRLPEKVADEYRQLRYQWKAMKTIEPTVEKSPTGDIDPAKLNTSVSQSYKRGGKGRAYQASPLDQLAKAGVQYMTPPDPVGRLLREAIAHRIGGAAGAVAGSILGPLGVAGGHVLGSYAAARLAGLHRKSPLVAPPMPPQPRIPAPNSLQAIVGANPGAFGGVP